MYKLVAFGEHSVSSAGKRTDCTFVFVFSSFGDDYHLLAWWEHESLLTSYNLIMISCRCWSSNRCDWIDWILQVKMQALLHNIDPSILFFSLGSTSSWMKSHKKSLAMHVIQRYDAIISKQNRDGMRLTPMKNSFNNASTSGMSVSSTNSTVISVRSFPISLLVSDCWDMVVFIEWLVASRISRSCDSRRKRKYIKL